MDQSIIINLVRIIDLIGGAETVLVQSSVLYSLQRTTEYWYIDVECFLGTTCTGTCTSTNMQI